MATRKKPKSDSPPSHRKTLYSITYFDVILLTTWDNVLGPKILRQWDRGDTPADPEGGVPLRRDPEDVRSIATYSIDVPDEGEFKDDPGIVQKFFILPDKSVVVSSFLIHLAMPKKTEDKRTFSLAFVLPIRELKEWLARRTLMENASQRIIKRNLTVGLRQALEEYEKKGLDAYNHALEKALDEFESSGPDSLVRFVCTASSLRHNCISGVKEEDTLFKKELFSKSNKDQLDFVKRAVTGHLSSQGRTLVIGKYKEDINQMICSLALLSTPNEWKMSLTVQEDFCCDVYLQGKELTSDQLKSLEIPIKYKDLFPIFCPSTVYPLCVVCVDTKKVYKMDSIIYWSYISANPFDGFEKQDSNPLFRNVRLGMKEGFFEIGHSSFLVNDLFHDLKDLPGVPELRKTYLEHFMRLLQRKALVMAEVINQVIPSNQPTTISVDAVETYLTRMKHALSVVAEIDLRIIHSSLGRSDPLLMCKYLPILYATEKKSTRLDAEFGVL